MASGNMKDIRRRIKSVESTMQITKAMELVASSKLRRAKERADNAQPYFTELYLTMCEIQAENPGFLSPFTKAKDDGKYLFVVIAGDRGLAGGFNNSIFKLVHARAEECGGMENVEIMAFGRKAVEHFNRRGCTMKSEYAGIGDTLGVHHAQFIAEDIVTAYTRGQYRSVELFYTQFVSPLTQTATTMGLLPVNIPKDNELPSKNIPIYEPSAGVVFDNIVVHYLTGMVFCAVLESFASEQAARRNSMENASDNAQEMINTLSLDYNRARQAAITQEITEIVAGRQ
ncbi:MAG: ATP synthase F1 subunit gamma [Oscillospiraceae bacterium]|nr:ATP synthase F1 subunit gamma [Oscillospiraceae bacterium]